MRLRARVYVLVLVVGSFSAATIGAAAFLPLERFGDLQSNARPLQAAIAKA